MALLKLPLAITIVAIMAKITIFASLAMDLRPYGHKGYPEHDKTSSLMFN